MEPEPASIFATTLVIADVDTGCLRAVALKSKGDRDYQVACVIGFLDRLNLTRVELRTDGEPSILALVTAVKRKREGTTSTEGSVKDSASMGAIETVIRWWQAKVRTLKSDFEERYKQILTADHVVWT